MNLKAFFYQQAVAMVAFSYVGYSSKTFSALPLDIHQPLFVFTDPTMYEWSLAVPLCFSAIFTSKALINQHFQGKGQKEKKIDFFYIFYSGDWILCIYKTKLWRNFRSSTCLFSID